ncbi:hypothetical protein COEREDRAFT_8776 [Coemansia reversa NRRL 1564]|uniref:Uncharacterized protein n=1 Tax=Coemansia reversa (strain ATCC 12441 / NRRL 1564) TaxID=763665 RepID=A0A2G5BAS5_COERN|nr:hypothetical protein COEREDRAFT_8776 [Coemansia reversa NRRL 1564]|eukprot:PIA16116.1 hypothetical protein COEREDRAFT_8776 [Coemansia reversa NRRL 1564]
MPPPQSDTATRQERPQLPELTANNFQEVIAEIANGQQQRDPLGKYRQQKAWTKISRTRQACTRLVRALQYSSGGQANLRAAAKLIVDLPWPHIPTSLAQRIVQLLPTGEQLHTDLLPTVVPREARLIGKARVRRLHQANTQEAQQRLNMEIGGAIACREDFFGL